MSEDWDLYAVVKSCTSTAKTSRAAKSNDLKNENCSSLPEDPLTCLAALTFEEEDDPFRFTNLSQVKKIGSLQDSYKPFVSNAGIITTNQGVDPCSSRLQQIEQDIAAATGVGTGSPLTPTSAPIFNFSRFVNQQQPQSPPQIDRLNMQQQVQPQAVQAPRSRKRKNQQKRTICHVTADNLSSDPWAWRKYGQKPIKGSPYTGDHTHPKPTHRSSLAGSTRNKVSTVQKPAAETKPTASCSSPRSAASLSSISPSTPLSAPEDTDSTVHNAGGEEESLDMVGERDEDDDVLIPNVHVDDDLFKGL